MVARTKHTVVVAYGIQIKAKLGFTKHDMEPGEMTAHTQWNEWREKENSIIGAISVKRQVTVFT